MKGKVKRGWRWLWRRRRPIKAIAEWLVKLRQ